MTIARTTSPALDGRLAAQATINKLAQGFLHAGENLTAMQEALRLPAALLRLAAAAAGEAQSLSISRYAAGEEGPHFLTALRSAAAAATATAGLLADMIDDLIDMPAGDADAHAAMLCEVTAGAIGLLALPTDEAAGHFIDGWIEARR